jgi:hypothetical protein
LRVQRPLFLIELVVVIGVHLQVVELELFFDLVE